MLGECSERSYRDKEREREREREREKGAIELSALVIHAYELHTYLSKVPKDRYHFFVSFKLDVKLARKDGKETFTKRKATLPARVQRGGTRKCVIEEK